MAIPSTGRYLGTPLSFVKYVSEHPERRQHAAPHGVCGTTPWGLPHAGRRSVSRPPPASRAGKPGKPTPVRALQETPETSAEPELTPEPRSIQLEGASWEVIADGACVAGGPLGRVHMLMLRFTKDEEGAAREAWVIGDHLEGVPEERLVAALHASEPRPERRGTRGFFEELGGRKGR